MLLVAVTTWAADFTLSSGSSNNLNWTSDGSSTCAPWANTAVTENLPSALSGKTVTKAESTVTINEAGVITVTFQYTSGTQRLDMDGVDLIDGSGNVVASDYHHGYTGTYKDGNVYTLVVNATGDYTLRYWVTQGDYLYKTNGTITAFYENTAVYERRVAVERITPVINGIRNSTGSITVNAMSSNGAFGYMEGSLANLTDGNTGTYFQTNWSSWGGTADAPHYIQLELSDDISIENFYVEWTTRNNGSDVPEKANIIASTTGEDGSWDTLQEGTTSTKGAAATTFKSNTFSITNVNGETYKYIRFVCTLASTIISEEKGEYAFGLSELAVKTELSDEDKELLALCDAAQAVIDDANSTAADINEQYKTLKLATVEKPTYPFTLTTDDANPVLYVIKSGRDGNPSFTLTNDGYISLTAFTGADTQVWYFKEVVNADYEYVLNIIPYAAPTTTMGYSSTTDNPAMVSNSSSNTCNEWILDQSYSILGIKPYERQSTYLSNNGGVGNKMGFWWQDPETDSGTALYITLATDEVNTLLSDLITTAESCTAGNKIGDYTETSIATLALAIASANSVKENASATYADKKDAIADLNTAIKALEIILPEEGKFYTITNQGADRTGKTALTVMANGGLRGVEATAMDGVFQFVNAGDKAFYLYSVERGTYMSTAYAHAYQTQNFSLATETSAAKSVTLSHLANGVVGITPNGGGMLHVESWYGNVVGWNETAANEASAWVIEEVEDITVLSHDVTIGEAGYATLHLNYAVTIPEGVEAYAVSEIKEGYVNMTAVTGAIPGNEAVILKKAEGQPTDAIAYKFNYAASATAVESNLLEGTTIDTYIAGPAYVLGYINVAEEGEEVRKEVGLYMAALNADATGAATGEQTHFKNNANKAYLPNTAGMNAASYSFRFGEGTTGIDEITDNRVQSTAIYDLTGRRVENIAAPGIYVVNGKKVLVK